MKLFEQNGRTYFVVDDYSLPELTFTDVPEYCLGIWGCRRMDFLKKCRRILYTNLLTSGKPHGHLHGIEATACERLESIVLQMSVTKGVTEQLKAGNQMFRVGKTNNIRPCAIEIVLNELIFE